MLAGQLEIELLSNMARLHNDMQQARQSVHGAMGSIEQSVEKAKRVLGTLGAGLSVGVLFNEFKQVAVETDRLRGSLETVTGSAWAANLAFSDLTEFAATTPFTLDQSVNAFIKLKALGLDPSERALASYGNTAAAMGKDMNQMIEAVADASTMEFERLKEFGIKASQQGDQVSFTFQGVTTTVEKNAQQIQEYLLAIGENQFGDAMANQMERLPGLLSNLEDNVDGFFRAIADNGGNELFASSIRRTSALVEDLTENVVGFIEFMDEAGDSAAIAFSTITESGKHSANILDNAFGAYIDAGVMSLDSFEYAFLETFDVAGDKGIGVANSLVRAWSIGFTNIVAATQTFGVKLGSTFDHIKLFFGQGNMSALEFAESIAGINMATEGAQRDIQNNANAVFAALDALRDEMIASRQESDRLAGSIDEMTFMTEGFIGPMREASEVVNELTDDEVELIEKLQQKLDALEMTAREQAIMNEVTKLGADANADAIAKVRELAGALYDKTEAEKLAVEQAKIHQNMLENLQREWGNLIDQFIDGKADVGDFFDTIIKGIKRAVAEAAAADLVNLLFNGSGSFSNITGLLNTGADLLKGGGQGGISLPGLGGVGSSLAGLLSSGGSSALPAAGAGAEAWAGFYGGTGGSSSGLLSMINNPVGWAVGAAVVGKMIHDATNDPDGFHRGVSGFLAAPTPGAPAGSTFNVDPFASGFRPVGFADGPASREDALRTIARFGFIDETLVEAIIAAGGSVDMSRATLGGFGLDGVGDGTLFGGSQRTTEAQIEAQILSYGKQLVDHATGLTPEVVAQLMGANSVDQMLEAFSDLTTATEDLGEGNSNLAGALQALAGAEAFNKIFGEDAIAEPGPSGRGAADILAQHEAAGTSPAFGSNAWHLQRARERGITAEGSFAASRLFGNDSYLAQLRLGSDNLKFLYDSYATGNSDAISQWMETNPTLAAWAMDRADPDFEFGTKQAKYSGSVDASAYGGINRVPRHGQITMLHEGERVKTKKAADAEDLNEAVMFSMNESLALIHSVLKDIKQNGIPGQS